MIELLSERRHGTATPFAMVTARLLPAVACGAAVGFERDRRNRPADLRTHILVCLAAVVLAVLAPEMDNLPMFDEVAVLFFSDLQRRSCHLRWIPRCRRRHRRAGGHIARPKARVRGCPSRSASRRGRVSGRSRRLRR
ncbi:MAG TPA: hypothetical protein GX405_18760 [Rhizobiales bacterium]|nr:hypothetical protein [Hyphomicrobiales bacterium]